MKRRRYTKALKSVHCSTPHIFCEIRICFQTESPEGFTGTASESPNSYFGEGRVDAGGFTGRCETSSLLLRTMIQLTPEFLKKNGKPEFVVLPYEEFLLLEEILADLQDLQDLRQAKADEQHEPQK